MSSSDDDDAYKPSKPIKRKRFKKIDDNIKFENVNLYSSKVLPIISKTNETILKQMNEAFDSKRTREKIKEEAVDKPIAIVETEVVSDDEVQFVDEMSPVKDLSVTPPPEQRYPSLKNKSFERKKSKLLKNVATMLQKVKQDELLNQSQENEKVDVVLDENFVVAKIRFQSVIYKYSLKKEALFTDIFKKFAKEVHVDEELLLFMLNDLRIYSSDSPDKISLSVVDFIDAFVVDKELLRESRQDPNNKQNYIKIHFQSQFEKHKQTLSVNKFSPFVEAMTLYAKNIGFEVNKLCFLFDGEKINGCLTAEQLELEDDFCIDVARIKAK